MKISASVIASFFVLSVLSSCVFDPKGLDHICGDGVKEGPEECDGTDFGGLSCSDYGFSGGSLMCSPSCTVVTDACFDGAGNCGNGRLDDGEECDGSLFASGATCESLGYEGGTLACTEECRLDARQCTGTTEPECGNGVLEQGEECDWGKFNSDTEPNACRTDCTQAHCGDGVLDDGEACDGSDFGGATCESLGEPSGYLTCTQECTINTSGCVGIPETCGNGIIDDGEECDDGTANSNEPNATCRLNCRLSSCGDGIRDDAFGEQCDWGGLNSDTEPNACRTSCKNPTCGDGVKDDGEACDGTDFGGVTSCDQLQHDPPYYPGTPSCTPSCEIEGCPYCGDGLINGGEECDDGTDNSDTVPNACRTSCRNPYCGDGVKDDGEECDGTDFGGIASCSEIAHDPPYHPDTPSCSECRITGCSYCGDGMVDSAWEVCDPVGDTSWGEFHGECRAQCTEMFLVDQLSAEDWTTQVYRGLEVLPSGEIVAVGYTEGDVLSDTVDEHAALLVAYDTNGSVLWHNVETGHSQAEYDDLDYDTNTDTITVIGTKDFSNHPNTALDVLLSFYSNEVLQGSAGMSSQDGANQSFDDKGKRVKVVGNVLYAAGTMYDDDGAIFRGEVSGSNYTYDVRSLRDDITTTLNSAGEDIDSVGTVVVRALHVDSSGVFVGGTVNVNYENASNQPNWQGFVMAYDADLNPLWGRVFGHKELFEEVETIERYGAYLYLTGVFEGQPHPLFGNSQGAGDIFVIRMDPASGTLATTDLVTFGGPYEDYVQGSTVVGSKLYMVGFSTPGLEGINNGFGNYDAFLCMADLSSVPMQKGQCWLFGSNQNDGFNAVALGAVNGRPALVMVGSTKSVMEPGFSKNDSGSDSGSRDAVVVMFMSTALELP